MAVDRLIYEDFMMELAGAGTREWLDKRVSDIFFYFISVSPSVTLQASPARYLAMQAAMSR